jgi:hypothetical protein
MCLLLYSYWQGYGITQKLMKYVVTVAVWSPCSESTTHIGVKLCVGTFQVIPNITVDQWLCCGICAMIFLPDMLAMTNFWCNCWCVQHILL